MKRFSSRSNYRPVKIRGCSTMNDPWEGTDFTVCPLCKQVTKRDELFNGTHVCWSRSEFIKWSIFPDM